jgi:hypothetical protein
VSLAEFFCVLFDLTKASLFFLFLPKKRKGGQNVGNPVFRAALKNFDACHFFLFFCHFFIFFASVVFAEAKQRLGRVD